MCIPVYKASEANYFVSVFSAYTMFIILQHLVSYFA